MCTHKIRIRNKAFTGTKKNNYRPPKLWHTDLEYIEIPCGKCFECLKARGREWKVRCYEELIESRAATFFTGTITDDRIKYITEKYKIEKDDVNTIITKELRLFLERIRKKHKDIRIKHWCVTERGHRGTERIHIHGLFFTNDLTTWQLNKLLYDNWTAGYSFYGKYVSLKTVNYIVKYLTKHDTIHPDFRGKMLVSPGLGRHYLDNERVKEIHRYRGENTNRSYTLNNGKKIPLPKYYCDKLYTDREKQMLMIINKSKGYEYVRGEKLENKTEEQRIIIKQKIEEYRIWDIMAHGDNPEYWAEQKFKKRTGEDYFRKKKKMEERKEIPCEFWDELKLKIKEDQENPLSEIFNPYSRYIKPPF